MEFLSFTWCCALASPNKGHQEAAESGTGTEYVKALPLSSTNSGSFPAAALEPADAPESPRFATPGPSVGAASSPVSGVSVQDNVTALPMRASPSVRSSPSGLFSSPSGPVSEKARLQQVVREFAKGAIHGLKMELINEFTGEVAETLLFMDRFLYTMRLLPVGSDERRYDMKDMIAIFKGQEFVQMVPGLAHLHPCCVAIDFSTETDYRVCFHFKDAQQRDQFYSCMKILRMSVDSKKEQSDEAAD